MNPPFQLSQLSPHSWFNELYYSPTKLDKSTISIFLYIYPTLGPKSYTCIYPPTVGSRSYIIPLRSLINPQFPFSQLSPPQCSAPGAILFTCKARLIHNYPSHSYPPTVLGPRSYIIHLQSLINPKFPFSLLSSWGWAPGSYIIHLRSLMNPPFPFSQSSPHSAGPQELYYSPAKLDKSTICILTAIPSWCWPQGSILCTCEAWWIHHFRFPSHLPTDRPRNSWLANSLQAGDQFHIR